MEEADENIFETAINLNSNENLNSRKLEKSFLLSCFIEDNIFKITARDDDNDVYLLQFRMPDWAQRKEKEFTKRVNTFNLLISTIKEAFEKERLVLYKLDAFVLMMTLHYTIIFKEETISFELHKQSEDEEEEKRLIGMFFSESQPIDEQNNLDYKAELIDYSKKFEDCGDRSIIRMTVKNVGRCTWDRKITSFRCVPEFSSLLCNEYFLQEDVYPDNEAEIELEFMKGDPDNMEPPYFTFLHLNVYNENYEPMLILDFNESFKDEINRTNLKRDKNQEKKININYNKNREEKIEIKSNGDDNSDDDGNKIIIDKEKDNEIKEKEENNIKDNTINQINHENNIIDKKEEINKDVKIDMDDGKSKIVFNNVKVNISFNVENNYKVICVDVNENKVKFNVDKNQVKFVDNKKNKIHVEEKKPIKPVNKITEKKVEDNNQINNKGKNQGEKPSIFDKIKLFDKGKK